jgi:uncharacterized protein YdeI (YjbR/CyaY-like superfamily)
MLGFPSASEVVARADLIRRYLLEAMGYANAGIVPPREMVALELPVELIDALDADPELSEAFARLTLGRQKSYVLHLSSAKTAATREARIVRCRSKILLGKGFNEY